MSATHVPDSTTPSGPVLYLAFELSWKSWKLAFTVGAGQKPRLRSITTGDLATLGLEIKKAKERFGLSPDVPVISCYEAGRDGFWLHRFLIQAGARNIVVDSASIEVNRRKRRAKSDRLDVVKLVSMLIRWHNGEDHVWAVVHVPTVDDEDNRQLHRELIRLEGELTEHDNRIKGLLAGLGLSVVISTRNSPTGSISSASGMVPQSRQGCGSAWFASSSGGSSSVVRSVRWNRSGVSSSATRPTLRWTRCVGCSDSEGLGPTRRGCWFARSLAGGGFVIAANWGVWRG